ncbi:MAG: hypothetical protein QOF27_1174, partial [Gaiellaceae bacterium]|nr:hypothetical protein [Gaiellaceae bacterium]
RSRVDPEYAEKAGGVLAGVVQAQAVLNPRFVARTVGQAARTAGAEPACAILRRPQTAAEIGVEVARTAFDLVYDTARDPRGVTRWASSSVTTAASLAGRTSLDAIRARAKGVRNQVSSR